jgi:bacteriocin-like protein
MKKFANLTLEVLSTEELMTVKGGGAPISVIIIREQP